MYVCERACYEEWSVVLAYDCASKRGVGHAEVVETVREERSVCSRARKDAAKQAMAQNLVQACNAHATFPRSLRH